RGLRGVLGVCVPPPRPRRSLNNAPPPSLPQPSHFRSPLTAAASSTATLKKRLPPRNASHILPSLHAKEDHPMRTPKIDLVPLRPAVCSAAPVTLDLLVRVTPPPPERDFHRPALNLALVLDRSGSMAAHNKLGFARDAAAFAVRQLLPSDRVSVTVFDDQ